MYDTVFWFFGIAGVIALLVWLASTVFRGSGGNLERYLRLDAQGPFVPLSKEEIADDERRKSTP